MPSRRALLLLLSLPACAELRRPAAALPPPPGLLPADADPGRAAAVLLAEDFRDAGARLWGDPARIARGGALLEWLASEVVSQPRWAPLSRGLKERMGLARTEMRAALGADATAPPERMAAALAGAHRALRNGDRAAAAAALPAAFFPRGGEAALARLDDPGPLPQAEIASGTLAEEIRILDATGAWAAGAETPVPPELGGLGSRPGL